jgi:hypothetical protein
MSNSQQDPTPPQELPCDFLGFLQTRRGVEAQAAADVLGEWLVHYEPGPVARAKSKAVVKVGPRRGPARSPQTHTTAAAA